MREDVLYIIAIKYILHHIRDISLEYHKGYSYSLESLRETLERLFDELPMKEREIRSLYYSRLEAIERYDSYTIHFCDPQSFTQ